MDELGQWQIKVEDSVGNWIFKIWLYRRITGGIEVAHIVDGKIETTLLNEGQMDIAPTFEINRDIWRTIERELIGNKEREKSEVEAELGATKYHLEDMRKLLKLNNGRTN